MFNLGDFLGSLLADFRSLFNKASLLFLVIGRFFFFYTILIMDKPFVKSDILLNNDIFPYINLLIFSTSCGLIASKNIIDADGSFILIAETAPPEYQKYAGVLGGISLQLGIAVGTILAIPLSDLINPS